MLGSVLSPSARLVPRSRATAPTPVHRVRAAWAPLDGARRRASGDTSGAPNGRWQRQRREVFNSATSRQGGAGAAGLGLKAARRARGRAFVHARPDHDRAALRAQIGRTLGASRAEVHSASCSSRFYPQSPSARGANRRPQSTRRSEAPERGRKGRRSTSTEHAVRDLSTLRRVAAPWLRFYHQSSSGRGANRRS